ncbi:hypothetical protein Ade02nite_20590 [Paractinoplanes deccanensis]|uniref:EF-hand domain-containing protein n=1 Tax=Paractinoplanes deccanensis TaxID=113561 RepID=A0ABQ3Y088_9ACTN|nr:hypothetical protein [Actinoplanes deccanensis]GID73418.1 hypothetical protein Ade02nite_20590 [Actinoplanes deccanensis]
MTAPYETNEPTVTDLAIHDLVNLIRDVDGDNSLSSYELGLELYYRLGVTGVVGFVERTNPDKRLGAGQLAELIVAEFNLDKES